MQGLIPTLHVLGKTLPEAWEKAVLACWEKGAAIQTEYDRPGDPPSRDCTMMWVVDDPFLEPRIHRAFPGGLEDLEVYRQEVVEGVHDHWIAPDEGKWTYTYHKRLFAYEIEGAVIDQVNYIVDKLSRAGHSRRPRPSPGTPSSILPPMILPASNGSGADSFPTARADWPST
jgi:thymidylate synthase